MFLLAGVTCIVLLLHHILLWKWNNFHNFYSSIQLNSVFHSFIYSFPPLRLIHHHDAVASAASSYSSHFYSPFLCVAGCINMEYEFFSKWIDENLWKTQGMERVRRSEWGKGKERKWKKKKNNKLSTFIFPHGTV